MLERFEQILTTWLTERGVRVDELKLFPVAGHQYTHSHPGDGYGHYLNDRLFFAGDVEAFAKHLPQIEESAKSMFEFYELMCDDPYVGERVKARTTVPCGELDLSVEVHVPDPDDVYFKQVGINDTLIGHEVTVRRRADGRGYYMTMASICGPRAVVEQFLKDYGDVNKLQNMVLTAEGVRRYLAKKAVLVSCGMQCVSTGMAVRESLTFLISEPLSRCLPASETSEQPTPSSSTP